MRTACCKAGSFCFGDFADVSRMLMADEVCRRWRREFTRTINLRNL